MERKNKDATNSCRISITLNPLGKPRNEENNQNLPVDENVDQNHSASHDETADLNRPHAIIPLITIFCLIKLIYPIINHAYDFVNDLCLAYGYFADQKTVQSSLTLAFTALQAIASAWISFLMHNPKLGDSSAEEENQETNGNWLKRIAKLITRNIIVMMFLRALPICQLRKVYFAWRIREFQQKENTARTNHYHRKMLHEARDSAVLGVVACFLQSAPQLILQLCILLSEDKPISATMWSKIVSGCMTLLSFGTAMKNYHCASRLAQPDGVVISTIGSTLLLLWHIGTIAARIDAIAIAANKWLPYTLLALVINWVGWTTWICTKQNAFSVLNGNETDSSSNSPTFATKVRNLILAGVLAVVYTFTFVNLGKGRTFVRNSIYHILCLLQNGTVVIVWFTLTNLTDESLWFSKHILIFSVAFFFIGIAAMITYYTLFHPTLPTSCQFVTIDRLTWV